MLAKALKQASGNAGAPLYVEDVFGTYTYTSPSTIYNATTVPTTNRILPSVGIDPDWQYVKRYLPLLQSNSYDAVTETHLGGNLDGGYGVAGPFGDVGVSSYAFDTVDRTSSYQQPVPTNPSEPYNYNVPWCIEAWVKLMGTSDGGEAYVIIHSWDIFSGSPQANDISITAQSASDSSAVLAVTIRSNSVSVISNSWSIPVFTWVFCSVSYDGTNIKIHTNGTERLSTSFSGFANNITNSVMMGCRTIINGSESPEALLCQYRATFGTARSSTRTTVPTRQFPITDSEPNCEDALLWFKSRSATSNHNLVTSSDLISSYSDSNTSSTDNPGLGVTSSGVKLYSTSFANINSDRRYSLWAFTKQEKFFDVVTYTGTGSARTIAHNLDSVPGCIIIKRIDASSNWQVYHRSLANTEYLQLNSTAAKATGTDRWNSTTPTSTEFSLGTNTNVNANGGQYVAYLFAHDAGGFGADGTENVISCGGYTGTGTTNAIDLGWEPQFVLIKCATDTKDWMLYDTMRGMVVSSASTDDLILRPNTTSVENTSSNNGGIDPSASGFILGTTTNSELNKSGDSYIYIAIRRGPMKVPTSGVSVLFPWTGDTSSSDPGTFVDAGFSPDTVICKDRRATAGAIYAVDRLRGATSSNQLVLQTGSTASEIATTGRADLNLSSNGWYVDQSNTAYLGYGLLRAPGFFDVVCYTGNGSPRAVAHNLKALPDMIIYKARTDSSSPGNMFWPVYCRPMTNSISHFLQLNLNNSSTGLGLEWWTEDGVARKAPDADNFYIGTAIQINGSGDRFVAYLFASCPGVCKVGSYTGTGTTQQINCGFSAGARFILIKRTDSTGDWYMWDSARGIVAGDDPYLLLNAASGVEITNTDYIDPYSAGFEISSTAPAAINANGGSFIFLAIA